MSFSWLLVFVLALGGICQGKNATIHRLYKAQQQETVCLDGSPPAYYLRRGFGTGVDKWHVYLKGGGWCSDVEDCYRRSRTPAGSSLPEHWPDELELNGLMSDNQTVSGDFYNWNVVWVVYCDGASFSNFLTEPKIYMDSKVYYKGRAILKAVFDALLEEEGMNSASEVLLTGSSAGGLATYYNADRVRGWIPQNISVKAMADSGFFADVKTVDGIYYLRDGIRLVIPDQNITADGFNEACGKKYAGEEFWKCFFPPYFYDLIKTPIFVLNSETDQWQLENDYFLSCYPPQNCTAGQTKEFATFREEWRNQSLPTMKSVTNGLFAHSCVAHTLMRYNEPWYTISVGGKNIRDAFSDWYFGYTKREAQLKREDCPYPCNPTCSCHEVIVDGEVWSLGTN